MRKQRGQKGKANPIVLTERDLDILSITGLCRYISTAQLAREFFPSRDRCRRRVRQLYDNGYIRITIVSSTLPNLVSLSNSGLKTLQEMRPELSPRLRLPGTIRLAGINHHLAVVDSRLYLVHVCELNNLTLLCWSNNGGELGEELGLDEFHLQPDGLAKVQTRNGLIYLGVEVDCSTESLTVVGNKLKKYRHAFASTALDELWLVLVNAGDDRCKNLIRLIKRLDLGNGIRVMKHRALLKRPIVKFPEKVNETVLARQSQKTENIDAV